MRSTRPTRTVRTRGSVIHSQTAVSGSGGLGSAGTAATFPNGIPSFATAFGFNKLGFLDHFTSTGTIDLSNTTANGFDWYLTFPGPGVVGPPSNPSWFSAASSILTVSSSVSPPAGCEAMGVACSALPSTALASMPCLKGSSGFYFETRCQSTQPTANFGFAVWMQDIAGLLHQINNTASGGSFAEIDVIEGLNTSSNYQQVLHNWTAVNTDSNTVIATGASTDMSVYHSWGVLIVPAALNGGTGLARMYLDRVQVGSDLTWSPGGAYSAMEAANFVLLFDTSISHPLNIDYIAVATSGVAPASAIAPIASGPLIAGQTVTSTTGVWSGDSPMTYAYQWYQSPSTAIGGATSSSYVVQSGDPTPGLLCKVTATNSSGNATASSNTLTSASVAFLARTSGLNAAHQNAYTALIDGLVLDSVLPKLDVIGIGATADTATLVLNLKSTSFTASLVGSPTFTVDTGVAGNGSSSYINSNYNPASPGGGNYSQNSACRFVWNNTETAATRAAFGNSIDFDDNGYFPVVGSSTVPSFRINSVGANVSGVLPATAKGLWCVNRSASNAQQLYHNGVLVDSNSAASAAVVSGNTAFDRSTSDFGNSQLMAWGAGGSLSSTDNANLYARIHTFLQTIAGIP